jgi:sulfate adenylyltransferase subunit 2
MNHLRQLEGQSVYILREAYTHFDHLAMLWSMGKDSTVLLWLARKAFFGHVPFPLVHIDTGYEMPELIDYLYADPSCVMTHRITLWNREILSFCL